MNNGIDAITLTSSDGASAVVNAHGAQVTGWMPAGCDGAGRLFLSRRAVLDGSQAIRGGIPVIFPQFANEGLLPKHGFARLRYWRLLEHGLDIEGRGLGRWQLVDDEATRAVWPQAFAATLSVSVVGATLAVTLAVENTGTESFAFTTALHTYLAIADIAQAEVHGLQHLRYRDTAAGGAAMVEPSPVVRFDGEVDRIYFDAAASLSLRCEDLVLLSQSTGFNDVVIWNPGSAKAAGFSDLEYGDWQRFVCIEPATIGQPVSLSPGERWEGSQTLTVRPVGLER